jgi:biotin carboxyl carrier protein
VLSGAGVADGVTRVGAGVYRVERDGRAVLVYVAGTGEDWWAFCEGVVFRAAPASNTAERRHIGELPASTITAPMPASVISVNVAPGDRVKKGDILVVLDAMKMEMPIRADADGRVMSVRCRPGELVAAEAVLLEIG